jgi:MFS family permease
MTSSTAPLRLLDLSRHQWVVLVAAWLGWGFDAFDALLFNYVAPQCIPTLLHMPLGAPGTPAAAAAKAVTMQWTGALTSLLLIGWSLGGILFGKVADRVGRSRTLLLTMLCYSVGTACCAFVPSLAALAACRLVASLGIGGEWAAGAAMVAEVMPEELRVEAGALLYTAAPVGIFLAGWSSKLVTQVLEAGHAETSWRHVFLLGLIPAAVALLLRLLVRESEQWQSARAQLEPPRISDLFDAKYRALTVSGTSMAITALLCWWSCNAFLPVVGGLLGQQYVPAGSSPEVARAIAESFKTQVSTMFNLGGLLGSLLTIPTARHLGRKPTFGIYFVVAGLSIMATFGLPLSANLRLGAVFVVGVATYGALSAFTYYLPELFPTRLRATGAGFCYNIGRSVTAVGPFVVGALAAQGEALQAIFWVGAIPLVGLAFLPWVIETRGRAFEV